MNTGWYYLHENGELIYKRDLGDTAADLRESDLVRMLWPVDERDRETAWNILVEGLAFGAKPEAVADLADKWGCNDEDAAVYAERIGARVFRDGSQWIATRSDFVDVQASPCGFGATALAALAELAKTLGHRPVKLWGAKFRDVLARPLVATGGAS